MKHALVLCLALAGCQSSTTSPSASQKPTSTSTSTSTSTTASAPAGDPCEHVGDGVKAIWDKQVLDAEDDASRQAAAKMRDKAVARLQKHCRDDGWTPDAAECVRGGSLCQNKLTPEQQKKLRDDDLNKQAPP